MGDHPHTPSPTRLDWPVPPAAQLIPTVTGDWRHRAACRDVDPELFHPVAEGGPLFDAQVAQVKSVCAGCPVCGECLEFALAALPYGIAGGMTETERRCERRAREVDPATGVQITHGRRVRGG